MINFRASQVIVPLDMESVSALYKDFSEIDRGKYEILPIDSSDIHLFNKSGFTNFLEEYDPFISEGEHGDVFDIELQKRMLSDIPNMKSKFKDEIHQFYIDRLERLLTLAIDNGTPICFRFNVVMPFK